VCPIGRGEVVATFPGGEQRPHEVQVGRHRLPRQTL
jgi:hypothetical protein